MFSNPSLLTLVHVCFLTWSSQLVFTPPYPVPIVSSFQTQEFGSTPEFSPRVWPFVLTRILLPVSRHAMRTTPPPLLPTLSESSTPPPSTPSRHNSRPAQPSSAAFSMTSPSALASPEGGRQLRLTPASSFSVSGAAGGGGLGGGVAMAPSVVAEAPSPARGYVLPLDVGSWVHTTVPQLFRAVATVVVSNAETAVPLGVPTLMAFFEPHVCCRRQHGGGGVGSVRGRVDSLGGGSVARQANPQKSGGAVGAAEEEEGGTQAVLGENNGEGKAARKQGGPAGRVGEHGGEPGWWLEGEMDAAAAAGAAAAEEAGVSGDGLMSRMALEAVGLLVEGLAGQHKQPPAAVLAHLCGSLVRMLHSCLPDSFGPAGRILRGGGGGGDGGAGVDGADCAAPRGAGAPVLFGGGGAVDEADSCKGEAGNAEGSIDAAGGDGNAGVAGARRKLSSLWPEVEDTRGGSEPAAAARREKDEDVPDATEEIGEGRRPAARALHVASSESLTLSVDSDGGGGVGGGFDGVHTAAVLAAALRLQRLLYGLARTHLRGLGEDQTRALLGGLSEGLRYARSFQAQQGLRASLFAAG